MRMLMNGLNSFALVATLGLALFSSSQAQAAPGECNNDDDCPEPACGGKVCTWPNRECVAAGTAVGPDNTEGWCEADDDCKCKDIGAVCNKSTLTCTITKPPGGTNGGSSGNGGSGNGGAAGTGGASSSGDGGGCAVGGAPFASSLGLGALVALGALIGARRRKQ